MDPLKSVSKKYCSVPQCSTVYSSGDISLHYFPLKDTNLSEKWKYILKIGKPISKYMQVCSKHFLKGDYLPITSNTKKKRLKKGVIPSQNLPVGNHEQKKFKLKLRRVKQSPWLDISTCDRITSGIAQVLVPSTSTAIPVPPRLTAAIPEQMQLVREELHQNVAKGGCLVNRSSTMPKKSRDNLTSCKGQTGRRGQRNTGENSTTRRNLSWKRKEVLILLSLVKELREEMDTGKFQIDFYKKISCAMKNNGYNFQPSQCHSKICSLVKRYTQIKYNNQTKETDVKWEYYDAVEELLGDKESPALANASVSQNEAENIKIEIDESPSEMLLLLENIKSEPGENPEVGCSTPDEMEMPNIKREIPHSSTSELLRCLETVKKEVDEDEIRRAENTELLQALMEKVR